MHNLKEMPVILGAKYRIKNSYCNLVIYGVAESYFFDSGECFVTLFINLFYAETYSRFIYNLKDLELMDKFDYKYYNNCGALVGLDFTSYTPPLARKPATPNIVKASRLAILDALEAYKQKVTEAHARKIEKATLRIEELINNLKESNRDAISAYYEIVSSPQISIPEKLDLTQWNRDYALIRALSPNVEVEIDLNNTRESRLDQIFITYVLNNC